METDKSLLIINTTDCEHAESLLKAHKQDIQLLPKQPGYINQSWLIMNKYIQMAGTISPTSNEITIEGYTLTMYFYTSPKICLS